MLSEQKATQLKECNEDQTQSPGTRYGRCVRFEPFQHHYPTRIRLLLLSPRAKRPHAWTLGIAYQP
jgi:hypothetical protein